MSRAEFSLKPNHQTKFNVRSSEHGFMILPVLMLGIFISIVLTMAFSHFNQQMKFSHLQKVRSDLKHLATTISMIYSDRTACMDNKGGAYFGNTLAQLQSRSASGRLRLKVPGNNALVIARNNNFGHLQITDVRAGTPVQPLPGEAAFVVPILISARVDSNVTSETVTIPFYFKNNAANQIADCYATAYTDTAGTTTLEDNLCRQEVPANIYGSFNQFCTPAPSPTPSPTPGGGP